MIKQFGYIYQGSYSLDNLNFSDYQHKKTLYMEQDVKM